MNAYTDLLSHDAPFVNCSHNLFLVWCNGGKHIYGCGSQDHVLEKDHGLNETC